MKQEMDNAIVDARFAGVGALRPTIDVGGSPSAFPIDPRDLIEGLGKALRIIEAFDDDSPRMSATEMSRRCGLSRTSARRYLLSLCYYGYAGTDGKNFWLLPRVLRLGQSYLTSSKLPRLVQPFIQRVSAFCGETVNVSVLDGHDILYVARSNSPRVVSIGFHPGARAPAHVVSPGPVILARMSNDDLDAWLSTHDFVRFTGNTVMDPAEFRRAVVAARAADHWITDQQLDGGLRGISTALVDRKGVCVGAVGMTVQVSQYTVDNMRQRLLPLLRDTCKELRPLL